MDVTEKYSAGSVFRPHLLKGVSAKWLILILGGHTAWGLFPVMARYLLVKSHLPTFSLSSAGHLIILLGLIFFVLPKIPLRKYKSRTLWIFAGIVTLRSVTNMLSVRYTLAVNVQLVSLLTPFIVAFINSRFFHVRVPRFTGVALLLSLSGACMIILGAGFDNAMGAALSTNNLLGIAIALVSSFFLALYMIYMRRTMNQGVEEKVVFSVQIFCLALTMGLLSVIFKEDQSRWLNLGWVDWGMFAGFILISLLVANCIQIKALKHISATLVSSAMAWRLVTTSIGGMLLLGERFVTIWQYLGAVIVIVTVTWYLGKQTPRGAS